MMGSGSPLALLSSIDGNAMDRILCSSGKMLCAFSDIEEPEFSIISTLLPSTFPIIITL